MEELSALYKIVHSAPSAFDKMISLAPTKIISFSSPWLPVKLICPTSVESTQAASNSGLMFVTIFWPQRFNVASVELQSQDGLEIVLGYDRVNLGTSLCRRLLGKSPQNVSTSLALWKLNGNCKITWIYGKCLKYGHSQCLKWINNCWFNHSIVLGD